MSNLTTKKLSDKKNNFEGIVTNLQGNHLLCQRLMELGFIPGRRLKILTRTLFSGPIIISLEGKTKFALRKSELDCIYVEEMEKY